LSDNIVAFLLSNVTSVVQSLDQGIIASLKVQNKKKLLEWVLFQFDYSTTHQVLKKRMPNVRHANMRRSQVWREMNPQIRQNNS
jgi:hypothetical protein